MIILDLDFLAYAWRTDEIIREVVINDFLEKTLPYKIDQVSVLDSRSLTINEDIAVIPGKEEIGTQSFPIHTKEQIYGEKCGVDVMNGVQDRTISEFGVGGDDTTSHPVMAMDDQVSMILRS